MSFKDILPAFADCCTKILFDCKGNSAHQSRDLYCIGVVSIADVITHWQDIVSANYYFSTFGVAKYLQIVAFRLPLNWIAWHDNGVNNTWHDNGVNTWHDIGVNTWHVICVNTWHDIGMSLVIIPGMTLVLIPGMSFVSIPGMHVYIYTKVH